MSKKPKKRKSLFLTGLAVLLPTLITLFIIALAFRFLNNYIAQPLGEGIIRLFGLITSTDISLKLEAPWLVSLIGFPLAIIIILLVGYLAASFIGRLLLRGIEKWILRRFPVVRSIYPYAKQFSDLFLSADKKVAFQKVVAVQYPRRGIYSIGFITSEGMKDIDKSFGKKAVAIFIPNSPVPFTGFTIFVPADEIVSLSISIDEAIRLFISAGVLIPPHQLKELQKPEQRNETQ